MDHCEKLLSPPPEIRERDFKEVMAFLYRVYEAQRTMVLDLAWLGLELLYINPETLSGLTRLNLSGNKFVTLPHQIPLLTRLMMTPASLLPRDTQPSTLSCARNPRPEILRILL
jgi:hypothetical protein